MITRPFARTVVFVSCLAASATAAAVSFADTPTVDQANAGYRWEIHRPTRLEFEVPTSWVARVESGDVMVIATPTPGAAIEIAAATGGVEASNDERAMLTAVGRTLQNARFTSPARRISQNGLNGWAATGTGKKNGAEVEWFTVALGDGNGHALLALGMYRPTITQATKGQIVHVLESIRPAR